MNLLSELCLLLALGLATSFVSGLLGIGGGIIRIPLFVYLMPVLGVEKIVLMHVAIGTSVALVIPTAAAASIRQYKQGNLDLQYYRTWALGIAVGVVAGNAIAPLISTELFKLIFVIFLLTVAAYIGLVPKTVTFTERPPTGATKLVLAAGIGLLALLTGTGGGALTTPSLKACSMPLKKSVAIASATGLVVGAIGSIGFIVSGRNAPYRPHFSLGYVNLTVFLAMLPTVLIGAPLGAKLNNHLDDRILSRTYAVFLLVAAIDMAYKLLQG